MKSNFTTFVLTLALLLLGSVSLLAQNATIKGKVTDAGGAPLAGASLLVVGTGTGTATDASGMYTLQVQAGTLTLEVSYLGYETSSRSISVKAGETATADFSLSEGSLIAEEIVVSASRQAEKITNAPATISVIGAKAISELPSFNVAELLGRQKGVDYVRSGILGVGVNARGFNSAFNPKNLQINDGRFSSLVATGLPLGALSTTVKEDIERIEVVLGPSSALFGPNAHNGLLNTITKDPRTSEGTTVALGATSALDGGLFGENPHALSARFRHASKLSDKLAFKVSGEYTAGQEFAFSDSVYIGVVGFPELGSAFDNEGERRPDYGFNSLRGEAQLYYTPKANHDIILAYGGSNSNNIGNTNAGRNQIRDWQVHWLQARYVSPRVFAQVYNTWSKTDSTFAMNQRTVNYQSFINAGFNQEEARARSFGEQWLPIPGFPGGGLALNRGALFQDQSRRLNAEVQYNNKIGQQLSYIAGVQYQQDRANSNGTYLLDRNKDGEIEDIVIGQLGGYAQLDYKLGQKFKAVVAARADNHDLYGFNFIPKAALVYFDNRGSFRLTYGQGIAAPTILNLSGNLFGGLLLGNGEGFSVTEIDVVTNQEVGRYEVAPLQVEKIRTLEAGYKGRLSDKLYIDANAYYNWSENFLSPAIQAAPDREFFDHDGNPATALIPRIKGYVTDRGSQPLGEITTVAPLPNGQSGADVILTYANFGRVNTYGADLSLTYMFNSSLNAVVNYSWFGYEIDSTDLANDGNRSGKVDANDLAINTPTHKLSLGLNYNKNKLFFSAFGRWVSSYDFFSGINVAAASNPSLIYGGSPVLENARVGRSFNYGPLGGFFNLDLSVGYKVNDYLTVAGQVGNVLNQEVREFVGSPVIRPLYSLEVKVNLPAPKK